MNSFENLAGLSKGQKATVMELSARGPMRRRLQDIGLIPGTQVECIGISPLGDPAAYLIRGGVIALRGEDASSILVKTSKTELSRIKACAPVHITPVLELRAGKEGI